MADNLREKSDDEIKSLYESSYGYEGEMERRGLSIDDDDDDGSFIGFVIGAIAIVAAIIAIIYGLSYIHLLIYHSTDYTVEIILAVVVSFIIAILTKCSNRFFNWIFYLSLLGVTSLLYRQYLVSKVGNYDSFLDRFDLGEVLMYAAIYIVCLIITPFIGMIITIFFGSVINTLYEEIQIGKENQTIQENYTTSVNTGPTRSERHRKK